MVVGAATAGLVALASAGTALLVLTGTSSVDPVAAPAPPLPSSTPLTRSPGVVVLPSDDAGRLTGAGAPPSAHRSPVFRAPTATDVVPTVLAFTDVPAPAVVVPPPARPLPALHRGPVPVPVDAAPERPGRHLAKGDAKHAAKQVAKHSAKHPKLHGKRVGWDHSQHVGNG
jgi:hypothetical protein